MVTITAHATVRHHANVASATMVDIDGNTLGSSGETGTGNYLQFRMYVICEIEIITCTSFTTVPSV